MEKKIVFKRMFLLAFCFSFSLVFFRIAYAKKIAVYFGGADGDPSYRENIFKESFLNYSKNLVKRQWDTSFYYSGNDNESIQVRRQVVGSTEFSKTNYNQKIRKLINDIKNGKISKNDSLLIVLDTHGAVINNKYNIGIENSLTELEAIRVLQKTASNKNIKLGIIGGTCYSGHLLKLGDENTCVITAATEDRTGLISFDWTLSERLGNVNNQNLEDLFLDTRISESAKWQLLDDMPQISTKEGFQSYQVAKELKDFLILSVNDALNEKRAIDYMCLKTDPLKRRIDNLAKQINEANVSADVRKNIRFKNLEKNLNEFESIRRKYITASMSTSLISSKCLDVKELDIEELHNLESGQLSIPSCYNDPDAIDRIEQQFEKKLAEVSLLPGIITTPDISVPDKDGSKKIKINFDSQKKALKLFLKLIKDEKKTRRYSEARKAKDVLNGIDYDRMNTLVGKISQDERHIYNWFYKKYSEYNKNGPNACRDFIL